MPPILCAHLLRRVDEQLLSLLSSLTPEEWERQTIAPLWKVRDVAAHLLDTPLRKLSMVRDGYVPETAEIGSPEDLIALVNRLNREGVAFYRRLSAPVLIDLMMVACARSAAFHEGLDPMAQAAFAVSWAGEDRSANWFDTARELTERWHHQQQIRLATDRPGIMTPEFYRPVLDCFMRSLPFVYRHVDAADGTLLHFEVAGESGASWYLLRMQQGWRMVADEAGIPATHVTIPQEIAWRIFTKGIDRAESRMLINIEGNETLGVHLLTATAIVG